MKLGVVVPCYNEEEVLPETARRLLALLSKMISAEKIGPDSKIYFVDDGSSDRTWSIIDGLSERDSRISGIKLARNCGHQNALLAGLFTAGGDALISIDADLQDDIKVMEEMVEQFHKGAQIVYGVRKQRSSDTFLKRFTAQGFYRLMKLLGGESIYNHADYRLMSRRAIEELKKFKEVNLFLRGLIPLIGFRSSVVYYDRAERFAGKSKYPWKKMIGFALNAITSFSIVPLRLITLTGFLVFCGTIVISFWVLYVRFFTSTAVPGWASTVLPIYLISGIQIVCIGIVGEYLGKIYREVKERPRYIIEKLTNG
ncbi:MAG: glycosyltransferase family 2 protein [Gammaproteobacteria bacterium]